MMQLNWRGAEYSFINRTLKGGRDKEDSRTNNLDAPIYAIDTESVALPGRYEPICFQCAGPDGGARLEWLEPNANALERFIYWFIQTYPEQFEEPSCFIFCHNLMYDWSQLCKNYPALLAIIRTGIGLENDLDLFTLADGTRVALKKGGLFSGSAPFFSLKIHKSKTQKFEIMFRDTFSFFPAALARLGKELGIAQGKMDRADDLGQRDFRPEPDGPDKAYFVEYAKLDAIITRQVALKIRELHENAGMKKLRVSGPGYAIQLLLHGLPDGHEIRAGSFDETIMQLVLDTYAGGRTGGIYHGYCQNVSVLDIHSSYPASMTTLPSFGADMGYYKIPAAELKKLTPAELLEILDTTPAFLRIDGEETDARYPCMIRSIDGKLCPVYGKFSDLATTGIELCIGLKSGSVTVERVRELVLLIDDNEEALLPFRDFARNAYQRKASAAKGSAEYTSAKLALNSSYGKLIESRTTTPIDDRVRDVILPFVRGMETEFAQKYYALYVEMLQETQDDFLKYADDFINEIYDGFPADEIDHANFGYLSLTKLEYGRFVVPAAAALITATSRARLLVAMRALNAIYWDTDSVFIERLDLTQANQALQDYSKNLPAYAQPLCIGDELGDLDAEIIDASGYLAGVKRYFLASPDYWTCEDKTDCSTCEKNCMVKRALHGIPAAPYREAARMIEFLATGKSYAYTSNPKPLTVREAKSANEIGLFRSRDYESKFELDTRLDWQQSEGGWNGTIKTCQDLLQKESKKTNKHSLQKEKAGL